MKSVRLFFFLGFAIIAALGVLIFIKQSASRSIFPFKSGSTALFGVYGEKKLYKDNLRKDPFSEDELLHLDAVKVFYTGPETTISLLFSGHRIILLGDSGLEIGPKTNQCMLLEGSLYWQRVIKDSETNIKLGSPQISLQLSDNGQVNDRGEIKTIDNYKNQAILATAQNERIIESSSQVIIKGIEKVGEYALPPAVSLIDPEEAELFLKQAKDAIVRLNWQTVPGIITYRLCLYGSDALMPILLEQDINSDRAIIDLLPHVENGQIFWNVTPVESSSKLLGVPSQMGIIKINGRLLNKESALVPPVLDIKALTVSGTMVLIEGVAQIDSDLYIDDIPVKKDEEGKFIFTLNYNKMGVKKIAFRLISPAEIETRIERTVTIFVE